MSQTDRTNPKEPWLTFHSLAAEHGDCTVLSYGEADKQYRLVVDAGVGSTADRLRCVLESGGDATWELLVVSHIDTDHIGGILALLEDKSIAGRFSDIWFNGRQHLDPLGSESLGVTQGRKLEALLELQGIHWNKAFGKSAVCVQADGRQENKVLDSGAEICLLSPTAKELARLRKLWDRAIEVEQKTQKIAGNPPPKPRAGLEAMGGSILNLRKLADTTTDLDASATNASSIAFIFEFHGMRVFFAGDAHPKVLVASSKLLDASMREGIHIFKLPHHGSAKNVTKELVQAYPATQYVVSTNGKHHDHPDDIAIARVVTAKTGTEVLFNYPGEAYLRWKQLAESSDGEFLVRAGDGEDGIMVRLIR
ncbi:hypothetical protein [Chromobacterium vaccinii]|uniref:hypothetical protein n=1 Tax=Chromobacterium vaccinii TaxID=1108595 RepID=UPI001319E289|nr:hypothetical protein [Chromobacterium vaccinii]